MLVAESDRTRSLNVRKGEHQGPDGAAARYR